VVAPAGLRDADDRAQRRFWNVSFIWLGVFA
jgi:hypothetical protein